jgi:hypothetical protein
MCSLTMLLGALPPGNTRVVGSARRVLVEVTTSGQRQTKNIFEERKVANRQTLHVGTTPYYVFNARSALLVTKPQLDNPNNYPRATRTDFVRIGCAVLVLSSNLIKPSCDFDSCRSVMLSNS